MLVTMSCKTNNPTDTTRITNPVVTAGEKEKIPKNSEKNNKIKFEDFNIVRTIGKLSFFIYLFIFFIYSKFIFCWEKNTMQKYKKIKP